MSPLRVLICRFDDEDPAKMTELASFDVPEADVGQLKPETALDELEATSGKVGHAMVRRLLDTQWEEIDARLAEEYRQSLFP